MTVPATEEPPGAAVAVDALVLHPADNVATALHPLGAGQCARLQGAETATGPRLQQAIGLCHKFALCDLAPGAELVKYGHVIGRASRAIAAGEHVHVHNLVSARGR